MISSQLVAIPIAVKCLLVSPREFQFALRMTIALQGLAPPLAGHFSLRPRVAQRCGGARARGIPADGAQVMWSICSSARGQRASISRKASPIPGGDGMRTEIRA